MGDADLDPEEHDRTLREVIADLEALGFVDQFVPEPGGILRCAHRESEVRASDVVMRHVRRLEGASDPADMIAVVGIEIPGSGAKGTVVLSYGPEASGVDAEVLALLDDGRRRH